MKNYLCNWKLLTDKHTDRQTPHTHKHTHTKTAHSLTLKQTYFIALFTADKRERRRKMCNNYVCVEKKENHIWQIKSNKNYHKIINIVLEHIFCQ